MGGSVEEAGIKLRTYYSNIMLNYQFYQKLSMCLDIAYFAEN